MNNVKPTKRQRKTFEIKMQNPDISLGEAMVLGGYNKKTSVKPKQNFTASRGADVLREEYKNYLAELGLGTKKIAEKMKEWINAEKIHGSLTEPDRVVPDYQIQIKAGEMLREDLGIVVEKGNMINAQVNIQLPSWTEHDNTT